MGEQRLEPQFVLKKLDEIPSLPAIVYELSRIINNPMSSTSEIEAMMSQDIGMTTKVLKLANSAFYAIPGGVSNLSRAVAFIGFDTLHQLVLASSIIQALDSKNSETFDINQFWKHSLGVAIATETVANHLGQSNSSDLFAGGLVHDIGKIALYIVAPNSFQEITNYAHQKKVTFSVAEIELGQIPHTEIGKILAEKWQLPKTMQAVSRYHHEKDLKKRGHLSTELNQSVDIVFLANVFVHALKFGNSGHQVVLGAPNDILKRLRIDIKSDAPVILKKLKSRLIEADEFIKNLIGQT